MRSGNLVLYLGCLGSPRDRGTPVGALRGQVLSSWSRELGTRMFRDFLLLGFFWNGRNSSTSTQPNNLWVVANQNYNHPPSKTSKILIKLHLRAALDQFYFCVPKIPGIFPEFLERSPKIGTGEQKIGMGEQKIQQKNLKNQNL